MRDANPEPGGLLDEDGMTWLGRPCTKCAGMGQVYCAAFDNDRACTACGGTGEAYGKPSEADRIAQTIADDVTKQDPDFGRICRGGFQVREEKPVDVELVEPIGAATLAQRLTVIEAELKRLNMLARANNDLARMRGAEVDRLRVAGAFLLARLDDLESGGGSNGDVEGFWRDFAGHVEPAIARFRTALMGTENPA